MYMRMRRCSACVYGCVCVRPREYESKKRGEGGERKERRAQRQENTNPTLRMWGIANICVRDISKRDHPGMLVDRHRLKPCTNDLYSQGI